MFGVEQYTIDPVAMFEGVIQPSFTDLLGAGTGAFDGWLTEFILMDDVPYKRQVIDMRQKFNILQNRDAGCELQYKRIMDTGLRDIETRALYAAVKQCKNEFYQGALMDWRSRDAETFGAKILPFFQNATRIDMASNCWFGDTSRTITASTFATTNYDGIFKWLQTYTTDGTIPSTQTIAATVGNYRTNPILAYQLVLNMVRAQPILLEALPPQEKRLYVDTDILYGYREYVRTLGTTSKELIDLYGNGMRELDAIDGIPIIGIPIWKPILADLHGGSTNYHAAILTVKGNLAFATDKNYGDNLNDTALAVWYNQIDLSWYYQMFLKAGTQIAYPGLVVYAV